MRNINRISNWKYRTTLQWNLLLFAEQYLQIDFDSFCGANFLLHAIIKSLLYSKIQFFHTQNIYFENIKEIFSRVEHVEKNRGVLPSFHIFSFQPTHWYQCSLRFKLSDLRSLYLSQAPVYIYTNFSVHVLINKSQV